MKRFLQQAVVASSGLDDKAFYPPKWAGSLPGSNGEHPKELGMAKPAVE
jgi:hypothetical protein